MPPCSANEQCPVGVRVARLDDERDVARGGGERGDDGVAAGHAERPAGQEVVLDVDGDERGLRQRELHAGGAEAGAQGEQARRAHERARGPRGGALALGGGVTAVVLEIRRLRRPLAVAHDLAQQRLAVRRLVGERQHVAPAGVAEDLMGAGVVDLARRQLHRVADRRVLLPRLLDELVDGAERLAAAQLRADPEGVGGDAVAHERGDPLGVEIAREDDLRLAQAGRVEQPPGLAGQRGEVAGVDPDRLQPPAGGGLRGDRAAARPRACRTCRRAASRRRGARAARRRRRRPPPPARGP